MLNQLSVRSRLMLLSSIPTVVFLLAVIVALNVLATLKHGIDSLYHDRVVPLKQIKVVSDEYAVSTVDLFHKYRAGLIDARSLEDQLAKAGRNATKNWELYLNSQLTVEEARMIEAAKDHLAKAQVQARKFLGMAESGQLRQMANDQFNRELYGTFDPLSSDLAKLIEIQLQESDRFRQAAETDYERTRSILITTTLLILLAMIAITTLIYRSIQSPLVSLRDTIARISNHADLTLRVATTGRDEIAETAQGFNEMLERIHQLVSEVTQASATLASAAEEMHAISTQVATTAVQQEQQTTMIATAITEMTSAIQDVAVNAQATAQKATTSDSKSKQGQATVSKNIDSIANLSEVVQASAKTIQALNQQTNEINQVVLVIRNVAEQTNLLALNAAIEAARAGDSGRGFAVVADEVRQLAHNTQEATGSINEMISKLQSTAKTAVDNMFSAEEQAKASVALAEKSAEALQEIASAVAEITDMNIQVSAATEEQTAVANEISQNINEFTLSIGSVTESSNQNALASRELAQLAETLRKMVSAFRI